MKEKILNYFRKYYISYIIGLITWSLVFIYLFYETKINEAGLMEIIKLNPLKYFFLFFSAPLIITGIYLHNKGLHGLKIVYRLEGQIKKRTRQIEYLDNLNRRILQNAPLSIITLDKKGIVTSANEYYAKLSGKPTSEIVGANLLESAFIKKVGLIEKYKDLLSKEEPFYQYNCQLTGTSSKFLNISAVPLRDSQGNLEGAISIAQDNTNTIIAEMMEKKKTKQLRWINQVSRAINSTLDLKEILWLILRNAVHVTNATSAAIILIEKNELYIKEAYNMTVEEQQIRVKSSKGICGRVIKTKKLYCSNNVKNDPYYIKDIKNIEIKAELAVPIIIKNEVVGVIKIDSNQEESFDENDISMVSTLADSASAAMANSQLYERIADLKKFSDDIINHSSLSIIVTDPKGKIIRFNKAAEETGSSISKPMIGKIMYKNYAAGPPSRYHFIEEVIKEKKTLFLDQIEYRNKDNVTRFFNTIVDPILDQQGNVSHIIFTSDNVTEKVKLRKKLKKWNKDLERTVIKRTKELEIINEKLKEAINLKNQFISDASHELRTPLTIMKGNLDIALRDKKAAVSDFIETLNLINIETDQMSSILTDLSILTRADSTELGLNREKINLNFLLNTVIESMKVLAKNKDIRINMEGEPVDIFGDAGKLEKMFLNLVSNAIKYGRKGGRVNLSLKNTWQEVIVAIEDNGIGIPEKDIPFIFERFYRVDKIRSRGSEGGTGLGLSICKSVIEAHQGRIEVKSQLGKGSEFIVYLPCNLPYNFEKITSCQENWSGLEKVLDQKSSMFFLKDDKKINRYMQEAIEEAWKSDTYPLVGTIIEKNGKIIGRGHRTLFKVKEGWEPYHAEYCALKQAGLQSRGATIYTTLEPCIHRKGSGDGLFPPLTKPCVDLIIQAGISRVIIGLVDTFFFRDGKSIVKLTKEGIQVLPGYYGLEKQLIDLILEEKT